MGAGLVLPVSSPIPLIVGISSCGIETSRAYVLLLSSVKAGEAVKLVFRVKEGELNFFVVGHADFFFQEFAIIVNLVYQHFAGHDLDGMSLIISNAVEVLNKRP